MSEILIIATGGTIDKNYSKEKGTYDFSIQDPAIKRTLNRYAGPNPNFEYEVKSLLKKDSLDMTQEDREKILKVCKETSKDKILITHGTDTMIDTAKTLSKLEGEKTIVLTGASKPEKFKESDADLNIGTALGALDTLQKGVHIAMSGRIYKHNNVKKTEEGEFIEN